MVDSVGVDMADVCMDAYFTHLRHLYVNMINKGSNARLPADLPRNYVIDSAHSFRARHARASKLVDNPRHLPLNATIGMYTHFRGRLAPSNSDRCSRRHVYLEETLLVGCTLIYRRSGCSEVT